MKIERQDPNGGLYMNLHTGWRLTLGPHVIELWWTRPNRKHAAFTHHPQWKEMEEAARAVIEEGK